MKTLKILYFAICFLITLLTLLYLGTILLHSAFLSLLDTEAILFLTICVFSICLFWLIPFLKINLYVKWAALLLIFVFIINCINIAEKIPTIKTTMDAIYCIENGGIWNKDINACEK